MNLKTIPSSVVMLAALALRPLDAAVPPTASVSETPRPYPERLQWWAEARFGLFIHWGPVSLKGTEISWSRANTNPKCPNRGPIPAEVYDNLYKEFNPTNFNAAQWVGIAKAAGMKYVVLTAKHCDGFLLWHSQASDHNMARTPFKRDICAELAKAARDQGMRIGWYFSPMDWRDPDFRTERNAAFLGRMQVELREILGNYGTIDLLWFDWDGGEPVYNQPQTYQIVKTLQPRIVINNRLDLGPGNSDRQVLSTNAAYYTPEQQVGAYDDQQPWESCMTISSKGQWAWGGTADGVKSFEACLRMLVGCAGGDGNLLLNVGPMPTGEIAPEQTNRLREMGAWLAKYGESIYGTRGGPFKPGDYGGSTRQGNTIYLHLCGWSDDVLKLPAIPAKVLRSRVLTGGRADVRQTSAGLEISVPESDRQLIDTIVALELDGSALDIAAVDVPAPVSLTTKAKATASNTYQNQPDYGPDKAVDGRSDTRWATDSGVKSAWLEVDLGRPLTFGRTVISQAFPELNRVRKFAIEHLQEGQWIPCCRGENPGPRFTAQFAPVTAQRVRLNITESTDGPTLWEFELFESAPHLTPQPARLELREGVFVLTSRTVLSPGPGAEGEARKLAAALGPPTGLDLALSGGDNPHAIVLELDRALEPRLGSEGYRLSVTPERVLIRAAAAAGLFYGGVTFRQLLPPEIFASAPATRPSGGWASPCVEIEDSPRFAWRGLLLDPARHFLPPDFIKKFVDVMALHKLNTLQLHLTDDQGWRLEIKKHPRLTQVGSLRKESPRRGDRNLGDGTPYGPFFYTQDQVRDLVAYAQERHVTLLPEIEIPGHFRAALAAYPEFSCTGGPFEVRTRWGIEPDILCPGNDAAVAFAKDVLAEVCALFPSRFIHIGGDEAPRDRWKQCPKCQARIKAAGLKNEAQLQTWLNRHLEEFLADQDRRLIGWDEILEGGLTPGAAVMSWRGTAGGIAAAQAGHDVVMSPTTHCYFDYAQATGPGEPECIGGLIPLAMAYEFDPMPPDLPESQRRHILGAQGNIWGEYIWTGQEAEYFAFPRAVALAEVVWSPASARRYKDFLHRLESHLKRLDQLGVNYRKLQPNPLP